MGHSARSAAPPCRNPAGRPDSPSGGWRLALPPGSASSGTAAEARPAGRGASAQGAGGNLGASGRESPSGAAGTARESRGITEAHLDSTGVLW